MSFRHQFFAATSITAFLALALALTVTGQGEDDSDGDGVPDAVDNCVVLPNGPLAQDPETPRCDDQEDPDQDGYGTPCDGDINNDGGFGLDDLSAVFAGAENVSTNPLLDLNCDGAVGLDDVSRSLRFAQTPVSPGPSGYACAGTIPCP